MDIVCRRSSDVVSVTVVSAITEVGRSAPEFTVHVMIGTGRTLARIGIHVNVA